MPKGVRRPKAIKRGDGQGHKALTHAPVVRAYEGLSALGKAATKQVKPLGRLKHVAKVEPAA